VRIVNASQYPDEVVLRLVRYAFAGIPASGVGVSVRNYQGDVGRGLAYNGLPQGRRALNRSCPFLPTDGVTRYVSLEMGGPRQFPATNVMPRIVAKRRIPLTRDILFDEERRPRSDQGALAYLHGLMREKERLHGIDRDTRHAVFATYAYGPYGGRGSVLIAYQDWQEGIIAYAAHEARHIWQFEQRAQEMRRTGRLRTALSEADAERYALGVLTHFRRTRPAVLYAPLRLIETLPTAFGTMYTIARLLAPPERQYGEG
jgi:hypothetical protein